MIDDESPARNVVKKYVEDFPGIETVAECKNALEAFEALETHKPDLLFLDINMPKISGLNFLKTIKEPPFVIITTAYREYAVEGFELDVVDYLHKPFSFERFIKAVNKVKDRLSSKLETTPLPQVIQNNTSEEAVDALFIKEDKKTYRVNKKDVLYIESVGDYIKVHTAERTYLTYMSLKKILTLLPESEFIRVYKSFIVSLSKIDSFEGNFILIQKYDIPIGSSYKQDFVRRINSFMG